jgi:hypothetical protein
MTKKLADKICDLLGHRWQYKDYSHHIKSNGDKFDFKASRHCTRCGQDAYFYQEWCNQEKSIFDYESDYYFLNKIKINNILYS